MPFGLTNIVRHDVSASTSTAIDNTVRGKLGSVQSPVTPGVTGAVRL